MVIAEKAKQKEKKVKRKTTTASILLGIFLIGIVSASVLPWFGQISGTATVEGPVFYLDGEHEEGGTYHKLYVNEEPLEEDIYFWNGHRLVFKTEDLEVDEFYQTRFTMKVWMRTNNSGNTIQARIIKLNRKNIEKTICEVENPIEITSTSYFIKKEFYCESNGKIDLNDYDRIGLELRGNGNESQEYFISVGEDSDDGMSRIEVIAI
jgi:hypothetical protein